MTSFKNILPAGLKDWYLRLLLVPIHWLVQHKVHPNYLTVLTCLFSLLCAWALATGHLRWGGVLILVSGTFDILDGAVARVANQVSRFGAFFDSTLDRYAEFFLFFGILFYYGVHGYGAGMIVVVCLALTGSLMVSYTRARAEGLGLECKVGWMQRPERIVLLGSSAILSEGFFTAAVIVVALLSNLTAVQRIVHVKKILEPPKS